MATFEGLPDPSQVSSEGAAQRAQQAEAANLAYRQGTSPVLPQYAQGGGAQFTQLQIQDDAAEQAKHQRLFHPAEYYGTTMESMQGMTLSQVASRYGTSTADYVQDYSRMRPSAAFTTTTGEYARQQARTIGSEGITQQREVSAANPFQANTAAGIAWDVQRITGGSGMLTSSLLAEAASPVDKFGQQKSYYIPYGASVVEGRSTVPTRDLSSGMLTGQQLNVALPGKTVTTYMPYGEYSQIEMKGTKLLMGYDTGELGVYQKPYGHSYFMLSGGGGRAALQSGMFTIEKPETPYVVSQEAVGKYNLPSGEGLSRLGAEAYGGFVRTLSTENTLVPNDAISRYQGEGGNINLANFVRQIPAGKAEVPGAKIPWSIEPSAPAVSYMDEKGMIPGSGLFTRAMGSNVSQNVPTQAATSFRSPVSFENIRESTMGQAPWLFEGLSEIAVWAGAIDLTNPLKTNINIAKNIALDEQSTKSFSGAIAHAQAHETGFFNRETLIYGEAGSDKLLSTVKGGYGFVSGAAAPFGTTAVAHTHTEPLPFLNLFGYSPVASAEDLSGAGTKRAAGITQESIITKGGILTYATPTFGEGMARPEEYRSATTFGGVLGASNITQQDYLEKAGMKYNITPSYTPLSGIPEVKGIAPPEYIAEGKPSTSQQGGGFIDSAVRWANTGIFTGKQYTTEQSLDAAGKRMVNPDWIFGGGLIGYAAFGEKSPEVIKGALASGVDFVTGIVGWTPGADIMRKEATELQQFRTGKTTYESTLQGMAEEGKARFGTTAAGEIKIDVTSQEALAFQERYQTKTGEYKQFMQTAKDQGIVKIEGGKFIENPELTYTYGEFTKWGIGAGAQVRGTLGFNKEQLESYGMQLEQKKGIEYIPEKIVFGTGYTLSTHPEKIVSAYIGGAGMVLGGELIAGIGETAGLTAAAGRMALAHPAAAAVVSGAVKYGVPLSLLGITYYGASEGLTASPERTTINIGKMTPELGGVILGGASAYGGLRAADAGYFGFQTKKVEYAKGYEPRQIDLSGMTPKERVSAMGSIESPLPLPAELPGLSVAEPYARIGSTRLSQESFSLESPRIPMSELPGVKSLLSGEEMGSVTESSRIGLLQLEKSQTSAALSMDQLIADYSRFTQPASARTTLMREQQAARWVEPPATGIMPMDFLPGVGKTGSLRRMAMPIPENVYGRSMAEEMGVRIEYPKGIGKAGEAGLTFTGAPMSEQMLAQVTTRGPVKLTGTMSIEEMIQNIQTTSRIRPVTEAAEAQRIIPSATSRTFQRPVKLEGFEDVLAGVLESEKRPAYAGRKLPHDMQIDYLREAMKGRGEIKIGGDIGLQKVASEAEIRKMIQPTKKAAPEWIMHEEIAPTRRAATESEIRDMIKSPQRAATYEELQKAYGKTKPAVSEADYTYPWKDVVYTERTFGPTRETLSDYLVQERQSEGSRLFVSDAALARARVGQIEIPGMAEFSRTGTGIRTLPAEDTIQYGKQQEREMQKNLLGTVTAQGLKVEQISVPALFPVTATPTRGVPERSWVPVYEEPKRGSPERSWVPAIPTIPELVIPKTPVPTTPWYPETPIPKIAELPAIGGGTSSGFGAGRGGFRFIERLSFAYPVTGSVRIPRAHKPRTQKAQQAKRTTSGRTR
jgi:hypothetical protein